MARFLAETPRDQEEIDRLVEKNRKLKEENERLKKEIEDYKKRHPSAVGIKNGKSYEIKQNVQCSGESDSSRGDRVLRWDTRGITEGCLT